MAVDSVDSANGSPRPQPKGRSATAVLAVLSGVGSVGAAAFAASLLHPLFRLANDEAVETAIGFIGLAVLALAATLFLVLAVMLLGFCRIAIMRYRGSAQRKRRIIPWAGASVAFAICGVLTLVAASTVFALGDWVAGIGILLGAIPAIVFSVMSAVVAVRRRREERAGSSAAPEG